MICFLGKSHAPKYLKAAAIKRGVPVTNDPEGASVLFVSEDTPTDDAGNRDLAPIRSLIAKAVTTGAQIVITSQVPPGFTRSLGIPNIYHQAETLRMKDAEYRAENPDYIAVGGPVGISKNYAEYLLAFHCPVLRMSWEEAEFSKIAVNMTLASQVDNANRLAAAAAKVGAEWNTVRKALYLDGRIGPNAYLTPGRWQDSKHLLRDHVTLEQIKGIIK